MKILKKTTTSSGYIDRLSTADCKSSVIIRRTNSDKMKNKKNIYIISVAAFLAFSIWYLFPYISYELNYPLIPYQNKIAMYNSTPSDISKILAGIKMPNQPPNIEKVESDIRCIIEQFNTVT
jgi:hypothetical protein